MLKVQIKEKSLKLEDTLKTKCLNVSLMNTRRNYTLPYRNIGQTSGKTFSENIWSIAVNVVFVFVLGSCFYNVSINFYELNG
jgi:hypothetical protein